MKTICVKIFSTIVITFVLIANQVIFSIDNVYAQEQYKVPKKEKQEEQPKKEKQEEQPKKEKQEEQPKNKTGDSSALDQLKEIGKTGEWTK